MKICHITSYHPGRSGLYEQAREQIVAETRQGLDSFFISVEKDSLGQKYLYDRGAKSKGFEALETADVVVIHQMLPDDLFSKLKKPIIMMAHGTPADCFWGEYYQSSVSYSLMIKLAKHPKLNFVTMWDRHKVFWQHICPREVYQVDPGIELDRFEIKGETHQYHPAQKGSPNIMWADTWRIFKLPFEALHGYKLFKEKYPEARLHLYAAPIGQDKLWSQWQKFFEQVAGEDKQFFGEIQPLIPTNVLATKYRAADILFTPQRDATRCIRECQAVGTPVVAGYGFHYSPWATDFGYPELIAEQLESCWEYVKNNPDIREKTRKLAETHYDINKTAAQMRDIYEKVVR